MCACARVCVCVYMREEGAAAAAAWHTSSEHSASFVSPVKSPHAMVDSSEPSAQSGLPPSHLSFDLKHSPPVKQGSSLALGHSLELAISFVSAGAGCVVVLASAVLASATALAAAATAVLPAACSVVVVVVVVAPAAVPCSPSPLIPLTLLNIPTKVPQRGRPWAPTTGHKARA